MKSVTLGHENIWSCFPPFYGLDAWKVTTKMCCSIQYDITILRPYMNQHFVDLKEKLRKIQVENLKLNFDKSEFAIPEVKVLRHMVSRREIQLDPKKTEAIQNIAFPKNVTRLKSFMGVIKYFRKFIPNCSILAEPLLILIGGKRG